jgi:WD40 repeat protein/energy-coupling factor transporter ATP-binding protein EcfA2
MNPAAAPIQDFYPSLGALQEAHYALLERPYEQRDSKDFRSAVIEFILKGAGTGALLKELDERRTAQGLLDYWYNELPLKIRSPLDPQLAIFNLELAPSLDDKPSPYRGLSAFQEQDNQFFFGREELVDEMLATLETNRFLAVVGSSGSGKSSVVLAGLLPKLKRGKVAGSQDWRYFPPFIPGSNPLRHLVEMLSARDVIPEDAVPEHLNRLLQDPHHLSALIDLPDQPAALITVDQFEETFTLCRDKEERQAFIQNLLNLTTTPHARHTLILTMRSDFESRLAEAPGLQELFFKHAIRLTALTEEKLHAIIEKPAEKVGLIFETGLVDSLVQDVLGDPSALPLLQFALERLWEKKERNRVTWEKYRQLCGGPEGRVGLVLSQSADDVYQKLNPQYKVTAKDVLLRLVRYDREFEVTSNRETRRTLHKGYDPARVDYVLETFVDSGLLRMSKGAVEEEDQFEVAHEALIRNWQTLEKMLRDERIDLRKRQRITDSAAEWEASGRDPGALMRGSLLEDARPYQEVLNELETEYFQASVAAKEAEDQEKLKAEEDRVKAEYEYQRAEDLRKSNRNLIIISIVAGIFFVVAIVLLFYLGSKDRELAKRDAAQSALQIELNDQKKVNDDNQADLAEKQDELDRSQAIAHNNLIHLLETGAVVERDKNPFLSVQLVLEGVYRLIHKDEFIRSSYENNIIPGTLITTTRNLIASGRLNYFGDEITGFAPYPDNNAILVFEREDGSKWIAHPHNSQDFPRQLATPIDQEDVVFSADNAYFVVRFPSKPAELWDTAQGKRLTPLSGVVESSGDIFISPYTITHTFVTNYSNDSADVWFWKNETGVEPSKLNGKVQNVTFDPNGAVFVVDYAEQNKNGELRRAVDGALIVELTSSIDSVAFSSDGSLFIVTYADGSQNPAEVRRAKTGELHFACENQDSGNPDAETSDCSIYLPQENGTFIVIDPARDGEAGELRHTATPTQTIRLQPAPFNLYFSPDGAYYLVDYLDLGIRNELRRTDNDRRMGSFFETGAEPLRDAAGGTTADITTIDAITFSPDGRAFIVDYSGSDQKDELRSTQGANNILGDPFNISDPDAVTFNQSGTAFSFSESGDTYPDEVIRTSDGAHLLASSSNPSKILFSPEEEAGATFLVDYLKSGIPDELHSITDNRIITSTQEVSSASYSPDGKFVAINYFDRDQEIQTTDLLLAGTGERVGTTFQDTTGIKFSSDSQAFVVYYRDQSASVYKTGQVDGSPFKRFTRPVRMLAFNNDLVGDTINEVLQISGEREYKRDFFGRAGERVTLHLSGESSYAALVLSDPGGDTLAVEEGRLDPILSIADFELPISGNYSILVYLDSPGTYQLSLSGISSLPPGETQVTNPTTAFVVYYQDEQAEVWQLDGRLLARLAGVSAISFGANLDASTFLVEYLSGFTVLHDAQGNPRKRLDAALSNITFPENQSKHFFVYTKDGAVEIYAPDAARVNRISSSVSDSAESAVVLNPYPHAPFFGLRFSHKNTQIFSSMDGGKLVELHGDAFDLFCSEGAGPQQSCIVAYTDAVGELWEWDSDSMAWSRTGDLGGEVLNVTRSPSSVEPLFLIDYLDGPSEVYRAKDGTKVTTLQDDNILGITFSSDPNTSYFAIQYANRPAEVFRSADGQKENTLSNPKVLDFTFPSDPGIPYFAVYADQSPPEIWRVGADEPFITLSDQFGKAVVDFGASPHSPLFVVRYESRRTEVYRVSDGALIFPREEDDKRVSRVLFPQDLNANSFIVEYADETIQIYTISTGENWVIPHSGAEIGSILIIGEQDPAYFIVSYKSRGAATPPAPEVRDFIHADPIVSLKGPFAEDGIQFDAHEPHVLIVDYQATALHDEMYALSAGAPLGEFTAEISRVSFPDKLPGTFNVEYAAEADEPVPAELRSLQDGQVLLTYDRPEFKRLTISPDQAFLAVEYEDNSAAVYRTTDFKNKIGAYENVRAVTFNQPLTCKNTTSKLSTSEADTCNFYGQAGQQVTIEMRGDFDTRLELYYDNRRLKSDYYYDRSYHNSQIVYKLPSSGVYEVRAGLYRGSPGTYTLSFKGIAALVEEDDPGAVRPTTAFVLYLEGDKISVIGVEDGDEWLRPTAGKQVNFSPDQNYSLYEVSDDDGIDIYPASGGVPIVNNAKEIIYSPDASYLIVKYEDSSHPDEIRLIANPDEVIPLADRDEGLKAVTPIPEDKGTYLLVEYANQTDHVWQLHGQQGAPPRPIADLGSHIARYFYDDHNRLLVVEYDDGRIYKVDLGLSALIVGVSDQDLLRVTCSYLSTHYKNEVEKFSKELKTRYLGEGDTTRVCSP